MGIKISTTKSYSVEEVVDLIKAREVEQGFYGTKGLTTKNGSNNLKIKYEYTYITNKQTKL
jgi:hypothetical protein